MAAAVITLYDMEESLAALLDTQDLVQPDQEQAFLDEFERSLSTAADKRDRVAGRLAKLEAQQAFAAEEIKRLQAFKRSAEAQQERLERYVTYVIDRLGKDAKGKYRKLEGNSSTLFLRACAASVEVTDDALIPLDYQRATVTIPASTWVDILNEFGSLVTTTAKLETDKRAVKAALDAGEEVPGAKLVTDKTTVGRK